jgi:hypothetical protein
MGYKWKGTKKTMKEKKIKNDGWEETFEYGRTEEQEQRMKER